MENQMISKGKLAWFYTKDGLLLQGFLIEPKKTTDTIAIFIHGAGGDFIWWERFVAAGALIKKGISFFAINTRGAGIIRRYYSKKGTVLIGRTFEKFEDSAFDIKGAVDFVRKLGYKKIILIGHSYGCQKSIYYISKYKQNFITAIVLLSPVDTHNYLRNRLGESKFMKMSNHYKSMVKKGQGKKLVFEKGIGIFNAVTLKNLFDTESPEVEILNYNLKNMSYIKKIKIPTLFIIPEKDEFIVKPADFYKKKIESQINADVYIIKNSDHSFGTKINLVFTKIADFIYFI